MTKLCGFQPSAVIRLYSEEHAITQNWYRCFGKLERLPEDERMLCGALWNDAEAGSARAQLGD
jgi:hypothetical protein